MEKHSRDSIVGKLKGKNLNFESPEEFSNEIVILDYQLSETPQSTCFLGIIKNTNQLVAVKRVLNNKASQNYEQFYEKYQNEVLNFHKVSSPQFKSSEQLNIVQVFPFLIESKSKTHAYIIMEFCEGGSLDVEMDKRRLNGQWFTYKEFTSVFRQILNGYDHLHRCNILHQNLKPASIFYNKGELKIGDFGFSIKLSDKENSLSQNNGSLYYSAPEKNTFNYLPSAASDIFSLGVLFYELIFDEHPYCKDRVESNSKSNLLCTKIWLQKKLETNNNVFKQINDNPINLSNTIMIIYENHEEMENLKQIIEIVYKMLSKDPKERISFEKIKLFHQQLLIEKQKTFTFLNSTKIPKRLTYVIEKESTVFHKKIECDAMDSEDIEVESPELYGIQYESERINIFSNFFFDLLKRIEKVGIETNFQDQKIKEFLDGLLWFNFELTFKVYCMVLEQIIGLGEKNKDILMDFYKKGVNYIFKNTENNVEFLKGLVINSSNINETKTIKESSISDIFRKFEGFLENLFKKETLNIILEERNSIIFAFLSLVLDFVKLGEDFTKEEVEEMKQKFKSIETRKTKLKVVEIEKVLLSHGISFVIVEAEDD